MANKISNRCRARAPLRRRTFGAQFSCSSALIRRRPLAYYQNLFDLSQRHEATFGGVRFDNHSIGFLFEFFWRPIFQAA